MYKLNRQMKPIKAITTLIMMVIVLFTLSACESKPNETSALSSNDVDTSTPDQTKETSESTSESTSDNNQSTNDKASASESTAADDTSETPSYYFEDLELHALSGEEKSLYDYEGELIILNFWATWCTYCEQEMPLLDALHQQEGISVIAIDVGEDADTVQKYVDRYGYEMDFYLDEENELASTFGVSAFPTSIFIGPDFEYYYTYPGMLTEEYLTQLLDAIETYQSSKSMAE